VADVELVLAQAVSIARLWRVDLLRLGVKQF